MPEIKTLKYGKHEIGLFGDNKEFFKPIHFLIVSTLYFVTLVFRYGWLPQGKDPESRYNNIVTGVCQCFYIETKIL